MSFVVDALVDSKTGRIGSLLEPVMDTMILELLSVLRDTPGKPIGFTVTAQLFTLDVLSKVAFGKCFGMLEARRDSKASEGFLPISELMSNHALFRWLIGNLIVQKIATPKDTDLVGLGRVVKFASESG